MYEKYSGLPDTTKSANQSGNRTADRKDSRSVRSESGSMEDYQAPKRSASSSSTNRASARKAKARKRKL